MAGKYERQNDDLPLLLVPPEFQYLNQEESFQQPDDIHNI